MQPLCLAKVGYTKWDPFELNFYAVKLCAVKKGIEWLKK